MSEKEIIFCKSGGCTAKLGAGGIGGIAAGLGNIQKLKDGEALGGRAKAADDFSTVADDDFLA